VNSIFKKGLLLIAAPLVFQAIFLSVLLRNERENAEAERWALHTRLVIGQAETAMRLLVQESSRVRGLIITGNPLFTHGSLDKVRAATQELLRLVADNPPQQRRVEAFLRIWRRGSPIWRPSSGKGRGARPGTASRVSAARVC
jgi:CHASE3 domain sensor protein